MKTYRELYYHLFHTNEEALRALESQNYGIAQEILIAGQQKAEDTVLSDNFESDSCENSILPEKEDAAL